MLALVDARDRGGKERHRTQPGVAVGEVVFTAAQSVAVETLELVGGEVAEQIPVDARQVDHGAAGGPREPW